MKYEIAQIFEFLNRTQDCVYGRSENLGLPGDMEEILGRFAKGQCPRLEIKQICEILRARPEWVTVLATMIREQLETKGEA